MWICKNCGELQSDLSSVTQRHPYGDGYAEETVYDGDCICGGEFVEATRCPICGEWCDKEDYLCNECFEKNQTLETAIALGGDDFWWFATKTDIEDIAREKFNALDQEKQKEIIREYLDDRYDILQYIKEKNNAK